MSGDLAGYAAMARQQARIKAAQDERISRRLERTGALATEPAAEPMACPGCRRQFSFGNSCPDCDVYLVSATMVGQVEPESIVPHVRWRQLIFDATMLTLITAAASGAWFYYLWGGWYR